MFTGFAGFSIPHFSWILGAISVTGEGEILLKPGATETLETTVSPENATNKTITWSSDKPSVATVDADGKVTAVTTGIATITARAGGKTATTKVKVINITGLKEGAYYAGADGLQEADTLKFTITNLRPGEETTVGININQWPILKPSEENDEDGGPWYFKKQILNSEENQYAQENGGSWFFKGTPDTEGKLVVSGTVQDNLPSGKLYITLGDYDFNIMNQVDLGVYVGNEEFKGSPIQATINNATAGSEIVIDTGTFNEALIISKALTLKGKEGATITGGIKIEANAVTIDGFDILDKGILAKGVEGLKIENNKICNIHDKVDGMVEFAGLEVQANGNTKNGSINVTNNEFKDIVVGNEWGTAMVFRSMDGEITITENIIDTISYNGLNIYDNSKSTKYTITKNTFKHWDSDQDNEVGGRPIRIHFDSEKEVTANINDNIFIPGYDYEKHIEDPDWFKLSGLDKTNLDINNNYWGSATPEFHIIVNLLSKAEDKVTFSKYYEDESKTSLKDVPTYVRTVAELKAALFKDNITEIIVDAEIRTGDEYNVYNIDKPVLIQGAEGAKVYGSFIIKSDDVTIKDLAIENKGDLTGESSTNRGGIYVFAENVRCQGDGGADTYVSRMNGYATARQNGWMSANDIRELEDLDRIPAELGGDLYLINGNMTKLHDAGIFANKKEMEVKAE